MEANTKRLKWVFGIIWTVVLSLILFFTFSVKVPVWFTAIKVDVYGQNVLPEGLHTWRNFINIFTHDVFKYPVFIQQAEYLDLVFQDMDGLKITADIGMDYKFDEATIGIMYENYKAGVKKITNVYMKTWVKNAINRASSEFKVDRLYGPDKEKFRLRVLENLKDDLDPKGIVVNNVYFTDEMSLPEEVKKRINAKIQATQNAMQKENELRAVEADAAKRIAEAKGIAFSAVERAKGVAEAKLIEAEAIAKANKLINASITNTLIEYKKIETWNGKLPQVTGTSIPMLNLK